MKNIIDAMKPFVDLMEQMPPMSPYYQVYGYNTAQLSYGDFCRLSRAVEYLSRQTAKLKSCGALRKNILQEGKVVACMLQLGSGQWSVYDKDERVRLLPGSFATPHEALKHWKEQIHV